MKHTTAYNNVRIAVKISDNETKTLEGADAFSANVCYLFDDSFVQLAVYLFIK